MADIAAALLLGVALLALIYWYYQANNRRRPALSAQQGAAADSVEEGEGSGAEAAPGTADAPSGATARPAPAKPSKPRVVEDDDDDEHDDDDDLTLITLTPPEVLSTPIQRPSTPSYGDEEEEESEEDQDIEEPSAVPIIYDDDAAVDEPTSTSPLLLISAVAQTDLGQRRKKNEDSYLCLDEHHLFVVADGMGGHKGGEVASQLAVETISKAFQSQAWPEPAYPDVPRRGSELAIAIQRANHAVYQASQKDRSLAGMGTTIVSARFSPNKNRLYVGHVGDSRCYRLREGQLTQLTTDHTMGAAGITGPMANHLSRAIGVAAAVKVDLIIARPHPGDVYLLCSDGLSKMASDEAIREELLAEPSPERASRALVQRANAGGGRENITVVLVRVSDPKDLAQVVKRHA
ncbi:MAG: serine/threonine-protein phosphatase [Polyangiaceae bacterium]|nr:serine/threonine-protein phosphatase [Polyangiaceae bacterium]